MTARSLGETRRGALALALRFGDAHRHALGVAFLLALVAASAALRISVALGDPNFDRESPAGLLKTDPALLYYITDRIVEA